MATLSHTSREKIALAVFAGLIVLSLCGFGWYLLVGHSWNVAASNIDDTFGSMDGYTAIVYDGVEHPVDPEDLEGAGTAEDDDPVAPGLLSAGGSAEDGRDQAPGSADGSGSDADPSVGSGAVGSGSRSSGGASGTGDAVASGGSGSGTATGSDASFGSGSVGGSAGGSTAGDAGSGTGSGMASGSGAAAGSARRGASASGLSSSKKGITAAEAKESYEEKGATVFSLDTGNPGLYEGGTILRKGEHRFGVFSVLEPQSVRLIERQVTYFTEHEVDFIVVLTSDVEFLEGVEGVDIVLSVRDEELFVMGETMNGTFFVDAPDKGSVGAILISPSNVVSAKVIEEL